MRMLVWVCVLVILTSIYYIYIYIVPSVVVRMGLACWVFIRCIYIYVCVYMRKFLIRKEIIFHIYEFGNLLASQGCDFNFVFHV